MGWDGERKKTEPMRKNSLEGVSFVGLLNGLQYVLVDAEGEGSREHCQRQVGHHRDDGAAGERQQQDETRRERRSALLGVLPIDQLCNWGGVGAGGRQGGREGVSTLRTNRSHGLRGLLLAQEGSQERSGEEKKSGYSRLAAWSPLRVTRPLERHAPRARREPRSLGQNEPTGVESREQESGRRRSPAQTQTEPSNKTKTNARVAYRSESSQRLAERGSQLLPGASLLVEAEAGSGSGSGSGWASSRAKRVCDAQSAASLPENGRG